MAKVRVSKEQEQAINEIENLCGELKKGDEFLAKIESVKETEEFGITFTGNVADKKVSFGLNGFPYEFVYKTVRAELVKKAAAVQKLTKAHGIDLDEAENALSETYRK